MKTKARNEALARTLSTGQGKTTAGRDDSKKISPQLNPTEKTRDANAKRYENLTAGAKAFIFTVIVKDGHAVCTIHYPGVCRITGYTEEEYAAQPLLWLNMIHPEDKAVVLQQIARLLQGETPPPIKHRILHKNGSVRWFRNTSVPVFDSQGKLIAYDGLVVDISEVEFAEAEQEHQIAELTSALTMVKALHSLLPICCSCKKIRDDKGYWQQIEAYFEGHYSTIAFTHGLCPDCAKRLYPRYCEETPETDLTTKLTAEILEEAGAKSDMAVDDILARSQTLITAGEQRGLPVDCESKTKGATSSKTKGKEHSVEKEGNMSPASVEKTGIALCLVLLSMTSCVRLSDISSHKDMRHSDPEAYFPDNTTTLADSIQPLNVQCPVCKSEGSYIQSMYVQSELPGAMNILYSQYVCTNSHEWLIGQKTVDGAVLPRRLLLESQDWKNGEEPK